MNTIDFYVIDVVGVPEFKYGKYFLKVRCEDGCSNMLSIHDLILGSIEECNDVGPGYHFLGLPS